MNSKFFAQQALENLFDPGQPYVYIFLVPTLILIALGRIRLAILWVALAGLYAFFGGGF
ncbi:MAG: hypothetical protein AAFR17_14505 [Pseudomonadota bacterium]